MSWRISGELQSFLCNLLLEKSGLSLYTISIEGGMDMEKDLIAQIAEMMGQQTQGLMNYIDSRIDGLETRTQVFIENNVSKKIESLFDCYKLNHEKQWELERKTEHLEAQIADLKTRLAAVENKIA